MADASKATLIDLYAMTPERRIAKLEQMLDEFAAAGRDVTLDHDYTRFEALSAIIGDIANDIADSHPAIAYRLRAAVAGALL